jgi:hypothetical protein
MIEMYILEGRTPVRCNDMMKWSQWYGTVDRHVAETLIDDVRISTVFLGLDCNPFGGAPLLFETMVSANEEWGPIQLRCSTYMQAEQMHQSVVERVQESKGNAATITDETFARLKAIATWTPRPL